jgi:hypothetical protein
MNQSEVRYFKTSQSEVINDQINQSEVRRYLVNYHRIRHIKSTNHGTKYQLFNQQIRRWI